MTLEGLIADIEKGGWIVWNLGRTTTGVWTCRLANPAHRGGNAGAAGYDDKNGWRHADGATARDALVAAGQGLFSAKVQEQLTIAAMLA